MNVITKNPTIPTLNSAWNDFYIQKTAQGLSAQTHKEIYTYDELGRLLLKPNTHNFL